MDSPDHEALARAVGELEAAEEALAEEWRRGRASGAHSARTASDRVDRAHNEVIYEARALVRAIARPAPGDPASPARCPS